MHITLNGVDTITVMDIDNDLCIGSSRRIEVITSEGTIYISLLSQSKKSLKFKRGRNDD